MVTAEVKGSGWIFDVLKREMTVFAERFAIECGSQKTMMDPKFGSGPLVKWSCCTQNTDDYRWGCTDDRRELGVGNVHFEMPTNH